MEIIDVFNDDGIFLGEVRDKDDAHKLGLWHKEVHVWVINDNGEFLMQKRSANKKFNPSKWAVCAGHVQAGESTLQAAKRELEEEVGITIPLEEFKFLFSYKNENVENNGVLINNCFSDVYIVRTNKSINEFKMQEEEVSELKFIPCEEVREDIK